MYEDNWLIEFRNRAAPRLRDMFERELDSTPAFLSDLLLCLRQSEKERARTGRHISSGCTAPPDLGKK